MAAVDRRRKRIQGACPLHSLSQPVEVEPGEIETATSPVNEYADDIVRVNIQVGYRFVIRCRSVFVLRVWQRSIFVAGDRLNRIGGGIRCCQLNRDHLNPVCEPEELAAPRNTETDRHRSRIGSWSKFGYLEGDYRAIKFRVARILVQDQ